MQYIKPLYLHLDQQDDGTLQVWALREAQQWEHEVSAKSWQAMKQSAQTWMAQFEGGHRPFQTPATLANLGAALQQTCFPFYQEMLDGGGKIVLSSNLSECLNLPWELLPHGTGYLGTGMRWTLRRTMQVGELSTKTFGPGATPLRVLFMACAPLNQIGLDFEKEEEAMLHLPPALSRNLHLHIAESGTFHELKALISEVKPHVVHLSGHGMVQEGVGHFCFENDRGRTDLRDIHDIGRQLFVGKGVRLVFISACQSSQAAAAGLCQTLIRESHVPLALGWAASIADDLATEFARQFYHELAAARGVDTAIAAARRTIQAQGHHQQGTVEMQDASFVLPQLYASQALDVLVDKNRVEMPAKSGVRYTLLGDEVRGLCEGFVGRRRELQNTRSALCEDEKTVLLLTGIGGAGKSTLATRLANRFQADGYKVVALRARDEEPLGFGLRLVTEAADVCYELGLEHYEKTLRDGERDLTDRLRLLVKILNEAKILLVLDNLESLLNVPTPLTWQDPAAGVFFETLFSRLTGKGRAILTCRYVPQGFDDGQPQLAHLLLPDFSENDFLKYFRSNETIKGRIAHGELAFDLLTKFQRKFGATPRFLEQTRALLEHIDPDNLEDQLDNVDFLPLLDHELAQLQQKYFEDLFLPRLFEALSLSNGVALSRLALIEVPLPLGGVAQVTGLNEEAARYCLDECLRLGLVQRFNEPGAMPLYAIYPLQRPFLTAPERLSQANAHATHAAAAAFFQELSGYDRSIGLYLAPKNPEPLMACFNHATQAGDIERRRWSAVGLSFYLQRMAEFRAALTLMNELTKEDDHQELHKEMGDALESLGDWRSARQHYQKSLETHFANDKLTVGIWHGLAMLDMNEGNYAAARDGFHKALEIAKTIADAVHEAAIWHNLATIDLYESNYAAARVSLQKSLKIEEVIGHPAGQAATWHQLAVIDLNEGNYAAARDGFHKALEIAKTTGNRAEEASAWHGLASVDLEEDNYTLARIGFQKALEIQQIIGNYADEAASWHQLATIDMNEGNYTAARIGFQTELKIAQAAGDRVGEASAQQGMATIDLEEGKYAKARHGFQKVLEAQQSIGDRIAEATAWHNLASVDLEEGNYVEARHGFQKALKIDQASGNRRGEAAAWHSLASVDLEEGNYATARLGFQKALKIEQEIGDRAGEAATWHNLATIDLRENNYTGAREKFNQALQMRQAIGDYTGEAATLHQIGVIAWENERYAVGIRLYAISFERLRTLGAGEQQHVLESLNNAASKLGLDEAGLQTVIQEAMKAYERDQSAELVRQALEEFE